jgi:hypothetical protein
MMRLSTTQNIRDGVLDWVQTNLRLKKLEIRLGQKFAHSLLLKSCNQRIAIAGMNINIMDQRTARVDLLTAV